MFSCIHSLSPIDGQTPGACLVSDSDNGSCNSYPDELFSGSLYESFQAEIYKQAGWAIQDGCEGQRLCDGPQPARVEVKRDQQAAQDKDDFLVDPLKGGIVFCYKGSQPYQGGKAEVEH